MGKFWLVRLGSILLAVAACYGIQIFAEAQPSFVQRLIVLAGLYVTLAVSLNLINGITGQFSIGHAAFYQVGAYTAAFLAGQYFANAGLPPAVWLLAVMLVGALAAAVAGLVVGLPSLRLKGDYLAIVTLGFGEIIRIVVQNQKSLGGAYGMNVRPLINEAWLVWLLAILTIAVSRNLLKTAQGLRFLAVREDEIASMAMGINVTRIKVTAFVLGAAFAGAAGAQLAHIEGFVSPQMFKMDLSFIILTMVVLGGTGSITGSALAAVVLFYLPEKMRDLPNIPTSQVAAGLIAVLVITALVKMTVDRFHTLAERAPRYAGAIVAGVVAFFVLTPLLAQAPGLAYTVRDGQRIVAEIEGSKLRLVVFAVTLVVLMLLRPQGVFAHHEFSWSWVKKLMGAKNVPTTEVSA